jgi:plasmid segregation protein ParM
MVTTARSYTAEIFRKLRERDYDPRLMRLTVVGGGGCLVRHFGQFDRSRVTIQPDICAAAKGYEHLAALTMGKGERK